MYKCFICHSVSPPGQQRLVHIVHRRVPYVDLSNGKAERATRDEIAREIPVCRGCAENLRWGESFAELIHRKRPKEVTAQDAAALAEPQVVKPPSARSFFAPREMNTVRPDGKAKTPQHNHMSRMEIADA